MKRLTKLYALLILLLVLQSCKSDDVPPQVQWEKMEFEDQGSIYSIHGSLGESMLLGTSRAILKLTDNGRSIREVLPVDIQISEFMQYGDTLYAISVWKNYYSLDEGETWQEKNRGFTPSYTNEFKDSRNVFYNHVSIVTQGHIRTPSMIMKSHDSGANWENIFPYKHIVNSMHLDNKDRLYLGANAEEWGSGAIPGSRKAILYYTKK
ncbi:WD40/YVTN/BNR-like repeat-containing protein [Pontibacter pamirensis]|uniref:WD40/YVTN/BNR-like repeat-containing protein n=1 Tax=Pontibacter pamirensis TaxID=2562824 RepID=UPI001389521A|nr:hypothetical protein [Pontibacter pamirensis]